MSSRTIRGTLTDHDPVDIGVESLSYPCTVTLRSTAVGRKIEISTDCGAEFTAPLIDISTDTMLSLALLAPVTHVRVTGQAGDTWFVLPSSE